MWANFFSSRTCFPRMCANPSWTNAPKTHYKLQSENFHLTHPYFELCQRRLHHACVPTLNQCCNDTPQNLRPRFSSHTFLFWTLPEQLSILHHACVPTPWTNVPRHTTNFNSENFHLTHPCFELCRNNSEQMTPRMSANPEPTFQRYTAKPQTLRFSSHTSLFWTLPEQLSTLNHACVPTHPEPTSQDTLQTSIRKCSSHTSLFWTLPEQPGTDYTTHVCQPILHQRPKTHYKLQIRIFSSHTSLFWTLPEQLGTDDTAHVCQLILNQRSKDTPQNLRPQDFHLTHPSFELCRSSSPYYTLLHHKCEPTHPEPTPQNTLQTSDPNFFISHIPVLNFAGTACHVTPRMWANPSCTNVPRYNTND